MFGIFYNSEVQREELLEEAPNRNFVDLGAKVFYRKILIQTLLASNYTRPSEYTLESLLLYAEAEWLSSQDTVIEISLVIGIIVRLAMKMGMHKEWKAHPDIPPLQREMRRRVWAAIHCSDIMHSFQLSLPPLISQQGEVDCLPPNNIRDEDFGRGSTVSPLPRPKTELTEASYFIVKYRMLLLLDQIIKLTEFQEELSRDDIRKYEDLLLESRNTMPPQLQISFASKSGGVPVHLKRTRINLDRIYQVSQCLLHRKFLAKAHQDPKLMHYRRSCIDAAMNLLSYQADLYVTYNDRSYPNNVKWRHMFSLISTDFFTAGMTIAMDLYHGLRAEPKAPKASDVKIWGFDRRPEMITALDKTIGFWRIAKSESIEAAKAWGLFSLIVNKAKTVLGTDTALVDEAVAYVPTAHQELQNDVESSSGVAEGSLEESEPGFNFDWVCRSSPFLYPANFIRTYGTSGML